MQLFFGWHRAAGLVCISFGRGPRGIGYNVHLIVSPKHWLWGFEGTWYDGPIRAFGLGPLLLVCW